MTPEYNPDPTIPCAYGKRPLTQIHSTFTSISDEVQIPRLVLVTGIRLWLGVAVRIGLEVTEMKVKVPKTPKHTYFEGLRVG